jgi:hypothetical protein
MDLEKEQGALGISGSPAPNGYFDFPDQTPHTSKAASPSLS